MRQDNYDELGLLLTAADKWRTAGVNAGVKLDRLETTFPDGSRVNLVWIEQPEVPAADGQPARPAFSGWDVHTG